MLYLAPAPEKELLPMCTWRFLTNLYYIKADQSGSMVSTAPMAATTSLRAAPRISEGTALRRADTSLDGSLMTVRPNESRLEVEDVGTDKEDHGGLVVIEA